MIGQGGPKASWGYSLPIARSTIAAVRWWSALGSLLMAALSASLLQAEEIRVRIAWGGGTERVWHGSISLSEGDLSDPRPLGVEADEPGSMWLEGEATASRTLTIQPRSSRSYDGVDIWVRAPSNASLQFQFTPADDAEHPVHLEMPLANLSGDSSSKDLDGHGNRLLVMRTPGDLLRVDVAHNSLVFAPGETFKGNLDTRGLLLGEEAQVKIRIQLLGVGGKELWSQQYDVQPSRQAVVPFETSLPSEEGVYDIVITAVNNPSWSQTVRLPANWKRSIAERRIQLLVLGVQRSNASRTNRDMNEVVEIDPANPRWFDKLNKLPQLQLTKNRRARFVKGPLGNGCMQTRRHPLGDLVQLEPNAASPDISWEAYWLPINQAGRPHILEIDYPSDVSQTLGVSIVEPNAAGAMASISTDSGFDHKAESGEAEAPRWLRHRLVFWPRTTTPLVLISNGCAHSSAVYGKIRVYALGDRLPHASIARPAANGRLLAAFFDRPLIPENFASEEALDPWSGRSLDDWWTFYEGGQRLVEYLNHAGYNGLMLGALADGSAIYPSNIVAPTPRHDTGIFFASGQDPMRKDVLEMLFRMFDREDLRLMPMVEFAATIPELETLQRQGGREAEGLEWIGEDGRALTTLQSAERGLMPYYNPLHPQVQRVMLGVLRELADRYASHPSFAGLAVRLSPDGYAQLPGPNWGLDDATIAQFVQETHINVPGAGPQRFGQRAAFLAQEPQRKAWLEWRASRLGRFYRRAADELAAIRPDCRLFLAGAGMINGHDSDAELRPMLPRRVTLAAAMLRVGFDMREYQNEAQPAILLRPERILSQGGLNARASDLEISLMPDVDRCFQMTAMPGSLFFHQPSELHLESFDQRSPFKPCCTTLVSQPVPSGEQNRRRFVHSIASLDSQWLIDGGWLLPMGQEESLRNIVAAYRALPAVRFQSVGGRQGAEPSQPVTFRTAAYAGRAYLYVVNDAPFPTTARVHIETSPSCRIEELTELRKIEPLQPDTGSGMNWEVALEPYDLIAVRFSDANVQFFNPQATWPEQVETAMNSRIRRLGARAAALRNPPPLDVVANPGFEQSAAGESNLTDWASTSQSGVVISPDKTEKHGGQQSVKLSSSGPIACLVSQPFTAPTTGRLSMVAWLRIADTERQPPLRLAVEGKLRGRDYYRYAAIGQPGGPNQPSSPITSQWAQYVFQIDDLPLDGLASLRVRFDLMGPGEVWVDDVQLFSLAFNRAEMVELSKLITLADVKLRNGQIGDCSRLLDGYWPRFLEENIPLQANSQAESAAASSPKPTETEEEPPAERSGFFSRMKEWLPESMRY